MNLAGVPAPHDLSTEIYNAAVMLGQALQTRGWRITTAESCTGGLIAGAITDVAGSSQWFDQGIVSYANDVKTKLLGVSVAMLQQHGAVSQAVVQAMAAGALRSSGAQISIAVSGVAGPNGGTPEKPVGTVWFAWALQSTDEIQSQCCVFPGQRILVRQQTVLHAIKRAQSLIVSA